MLGRREQVLQEPREAWGAGVRETKSGKAMDICISAGISVPAGECVCQGPGWILGDQEDFHGGWWQQGWPDIDRRRDPHTVRWKAHGDGQTIFK